MTRYRLLLLAASFSGIVLSAAGQEGWMPFGRNASLRQTREPAQVKSGHGALAFDYKIQPNQVGVAMLPIGWLAADEAAAVLARDHRGEGQGLSLLDMALEQ
jgi:hypothetical protein